jgi:alkylhydroperoxidase family enzyme
MARVPLPTREEFPEELRHVYDRMLKERGDPAPHVFLALCNIPALLQPLLDFTSAMRHGAVMDARYREMGVVMTAHTAHSTYEFNKHWNHALKAGARREQLEAIEASASVEALLASPLFDAKERAVLAYAAEATAQIEVSDATWNALVEVFPQREAMDLVMAVAWYNAVARINGPLKVALEPWFKRA